ncbi:MAG: hypothetical protein RXR20_03645 [Paraburkholderia sp.]|jgi:hypothetical protein|uniref:hypothetical protein n=1 Tax=Burkholderiaceae TaxID=119060 RepID=UPI0010F955D8|nr:hypothetical protein [Burkholderia sp. 4M9327F10]
MTRPVEYSNLIKARVFVEQAATPGAIDAYLKNADAFLGAAQLLMNAEDIYMPAFSAAYEGFFQVVQAVLEFYEVRIKDAGRNAAIQRVCADLKMNSTEIKLVTNAHGRRNDTSYISPIPPISKAEAKALIDILRKYLPVVSVLTQTGNV